MMQWTKRSTLVVVAICLAVCFHVTTSHCSITLDKQVPVQSEEVRIHLADEDGNPVGGATVEVTYRPGSSVSSTDPIGATDSGGTITWTPTDAGLATITAAWTPPGQAETTTSAQTVSVKFASVPIDGILIMLFAGVVLIGGSIVRISNLLRSPNGG